jgi:hypothetical protein
MPGDTMGKNLKLRERHYEQLPDLGFIELRAVA